MVVDVTVVLVRPSLASPHAVSFDRAGVQGPVDHVQVVNVLFDDVVAPRPSEIIPIQELPLHVAPFGLAFNYPDYAAIPIRPGINNLSKCAVMDSLNRFLIGLLVTP